MASSKISAFFFISIFCISSFSPILGCGTCEKPPPTHHNHKKPPRVVPPIVKPPIVKPPIVLPPIVKPPVVLPPIVKPPVVLPPIVKPPVVLPPIVKPPVVLPPIVKPPVVLPPIVKPPVVLPPIVLPPIGNTPGIVNPPPISVQPPSGQPCPPPPSGGAGEESCPVDTLKFGACVDLLGGMVHVGVGDPVVNQCCPLLQGLVEAEAAVCLCTTIKLKALNLKIYVPVALQLLITCGKTPPPGYTCSI